VVVSPYRRRQLFYEHDWFDPTPTDTDRVPLHRLLCGRVVTGVSDELVVGREAGQCHDHSDETAVTK
jgi:hypothetical protein